MEKTHWAWLPGRLRSAPVGRDRTHHLIGGHAARQGANVAIFERPLRPEGDLDRLFAVGEIMTWTTFPTRSTPAGIPGRRTRSPQEATKGKKRGWCYEYRYE